MARQAGVSAGTVSNALSGKRQVDPETRLRIEAAVRSLGYVPNVAARALRHGRSNLIALCSSMPWQIAGGPSQLGFMMEIVAAVSPIALQQGTAVTLLPPEADAGTFLGRIALDGAIVIEPLREDPFLDVLGRLALPVVTLGRPPSGKWTHVDLDYPAITHLLCEHLHVSGARRFPLLTGAEDRIVYDDTIEAYLAFARRIGMIPEVIRLPEAGGEAAAAARIRDRIVQRDIDAVLAPIDAFASGVMAAAKQAGIRVPEELRVATRHDGFRARHEYPALTAVDLHLAEAASQCTRLLLSKIEGGAVPFRTPITPPGLVVRGSTASGSG
ncbi:substrate-binding domain-containing protein [uncultured Paracoccus sp.]|uniref:substrate-binding domain-containing protein n=1 Tax=uncultured Paracoccus sp. TaxID=189685 RepID=UPI0025FAEEFC|nr:substrate-binding domain-containing protein [uncultured Paracoccus sp.]